MYSVVFQVNYSVKTQPRQVINHGSSCNLVPHWDQVSTIQSGTLFSLPGMTIINFILPNSKHFHFVMTQESQKGEAGGDGEIAYSSGQNLETLTTLRHS